uniref:CUB domain-containing protein n=1 Tax=Steinernema glaseri TaxID=37863 RepID=A0A1I7YU34_9BILA
MSRARFRVTVSTLRLVARKLSLDCRGRDNVLFSSAEESFPAVALNEQVIWTFRISHRGQVGFARNWYLLIED